MDFHYHSSAAVFH